MSHFVFVGFNPIARVADEATGEAMKKTLGETARVISSHAMLAATFTDLDMRSARAMLAVKEYDPPLNLEAFSAEVAHLVHHAYKPTRDRVASATRLWDALQAFQFKHAPTAPKKTVGGIKSWIRTCFWDREEVTVETLLKDGTYTLQSLRTAIGDLKNPKYAGGDVLVLNFTKETETYVRA